MRMSRPSAKTCQWKYAPPVAVRPGPLHGSFLCRFDYLASLQLRAFLLHRTRAPDRRGRTTTLAVSRVTRPVRAALPVGCARAVGSRGPRNWVRGDAGQYVGQLWWGRGPAKRRRVRVRTQMCLKSRRTPAPQSVSQLYVAVPPPPHHCPVSLTSCALEGNSLVLWLTLGQLLG
jgi:hypothetical protein